MRETTLTTAFRSVRPKREYLTEWKCVPYGCRETDKTKLAYSTIMGHLHWPKPLPLL